MCLSLFPFYYLALVPSHLLMLLWFFTKREVIQMLFALLSHRALRWDGRDRQITSLRQRRRSQSAARSYLFFSSVISESKGVCLLLDQKNPLCVLCLWTSILAIELDTRLLLSWNSQYMSRKMLTVSVLMSSALLALRASCFHIAGCVWCS